ncbi:hypothetical protein ACIA8H_12905 [Streptomyces goshikiensis]|uniref:hypothetical protein n=1 Tax=Streptomyces goshikiensis TaxID=1942 RepID=UPI0037B773AA
MTNWWTAKTQAVAEQKRQDEQAAMAAELTYRNPNLGSWAQAAVEKRRAQDERNRAAAGAMSFHGGLEGLREAAHMRAVQQYTNTAHRIARGHLSELEPNPADLSQYADVHRPRASYSDVF